MLINELKLVTLDEVMANGNVGVSEPVFVIGS
jgi:hypothetical protein